MQYVWQGSHPLTPVPSLAPSEILAGSGFYSSFFVYTVSISEATGVIHSSIILKSLITSRQKQKDFYVRLTVHH
jgi:hypothetical protein